VGLSEAKQLISSIWTNLFGAELMNFVQNEEEPLPTADCCSFDLRFLFILLLNNLVIFNIYSSRCEKMKR
jgi:hypothetical protein